MGNRGLKIIGLILGGAIIGIAIYTWMDSRQKTYDRNVDTAFAAAKARLMQGPPSQNPFAKEDKAYPAFEDECELTALSVLQYVGGPDKGKRIKGFDLLGFIPAFDNYEIAIYKMVGDSGRAYAVGCLMKEGFDWKGTRIIFASGRSPTSPHSQ